MLPKLTKVVNDAIMLMPTCMLVYDGVRNIPNHLYYHKITYMHEGIRIMAPICHFYAISKERIYCTTPFSHCTLQLYVLQCYGHMLIAIATFDVPWVLYTHI